MKRKRDEKCTVKRKERKESKEKGIKRDLEKLRMMRKRDSGERGGKK